MNITSIVKKVIFNNSENVNIRAALIHIIGDIIQSVGVVIASFVIYIDPTWKIIDPICTFLFSIIVLFTTYNVTKQCIFILLESTPSKYEKLEDHLKEKFTIKDIHKLHIWSLSTDKDCITFHAVTETSQQLIYQYLKKKYNFFEITIQIETEQENLLCNKFI
jgi:zinc transporter 2